MEDKNVSLKNGSKAPLSIVNATVISLKGLLTEGGIPGILQVYDLAMYCRDSSYKMSATNKAALQDLALLQSDGQPHDCVKDTVLSAVVGEGLGLNLVSPLLETESE